MESSYIGPSKQDSLRDIIRSTKPLSSNNSKVQELSKQDLLTIPRGSIHSNSRYTSTSLDPLDEEVSQPSLILPSEPRLSAPLPALSQSDFDWTFGHGREAQTSTHLLGLRASTPLSLDNSGRSSSASTQPANMSVVGIQQYDSRFDAGLNGIRQSYTWPAFDLGINQQFFSPMSSPALSGTMAQFEEPKFMPTYTRSSSNTPPRGSLTPEQRELKKQRDSARRDSKTKYRRERSGSNSYVVSQHPSPALLPGTLSEYTNSVSPSPLLSHASPALSSPGFLTSFVPPLSESPVPDMYAPVYTMGPTDFTTAAYTMPYTDPVAALQTQNFIPRQQSMSISSDHQLYHPQPQLHLSAKLETGDHVRVVHSRPKPQCWEHGCNGRQFSTFSNLLRHQREKSGAAAKSSCPNCGAEFTRTTARNGHMAHEKCKQRRNS